MIKVFTIKDKLKWVFYVENSAEFDFYHTWHYNSLDTSGRALLLVYEESGDYIAFPLIEREVPNSKHIDLTCVYGYTGPISNKASDNLDDSLLRNFKTALTGFLSTENYVSVFSRLNPFSTQHIILEKFGGVYDNGLTVAFDLSISIEEQRKKYRQTTMDAVRHAWKKKFTVREEKGPEAMTLFVDIYTENMKRVGASEYYYFNKNYFDKLLNTQEYDGRLLMVYDGDIAICSTIIMLTNGIIQAHLIGTRLEYLHQSPSKFLADEISLLGRKSGMRYYNLGGGIGFKQDSLFNWKLGFTDYCLKFRSWRFVVDTSTYQKLLEDKGIDQNSKVDFFPLYRYTF